MQLPSISIPSQFTTCKSLDDRSGTTFLDLLVFPYHLRECLYDSQPGLSTKSHFRDDSLDNIQGQLSSVGFTRKQTLRR